MATPADTADTAENQRQLLELQDALRERDQVVELLTQRLEQAADQLDRWQRNGGERRAASAPATSADAGHEHQSLFEQMARVFGEWEELQAGQMLARIETQVLELKNLLNSRDVMAAPHGSASATAVKSPVASASASSSPTNSAAPEKSGWEAIKASLMSGDSPTEARSPATPEPIAAPPASEQIDKSATAVERKHCEALPPLPPPPRIIDVARAPLDSLRDAVESRDDFILALLRRIAAHDQPATLPDWEKLSQVPAELRSGLEDLHQRLQETLRVTEIDLSMQRAKLAREDMKLQSRAEQVARQQRQMGLPTDDPAAAHSGKSPADAQNSQGRRWLQFLQRSAPAGTDSDDKAR